MRRVLDGDRDGSSRVGALIRVRNRLRVSRAIVSLASLLLALAVAPRAALAVPVVNVFNGVPTFDGSFVNATSLSQNL